jgi:hypothetical protein
MPSAELEPMIQVFERMKTVHALDSRPLWSAAKICRTSLSQIFECVREIREQFH